MDITNLVTHISSTCTLAAQVAAAEDVSQDVVDTHKIIYDLIKDTVSGRAYPLKLPGDKVFPSLVYQRVSTSKVSYSQFNFLQSDIFVVYFQSKTYEELADIQNTLVAALTNYNVANAAGDIEITDTAEEYLSDQELYQSAIELSIIQLNGSNQAIPAIFVYESEDNSGNNEMLNQVIQWDNVTLNMIIIAKHADMDTVREQLQSAVLGYREANYGAGAQRNKAARLESLTNTSIWEEQYNLKLRPLYTTSR